MDKQKQMIEEMAKDLYGIQTYAYMEIYPCRQKQPNEIVAEHLVRKGWIKSDENAVVLTEEKLREIVEEQYKLALKDKVVLSNDEFWKLSNKFSKKELDEIVEFHKNKTRKETAEKFAERLKAKQTPLDEYDEISIGSLFSDIDEICKEFTEVNNV